LWSQTEGQPALLIVRVAPDAQLEVDGYMTKQTGGVRRFHSPPLAVDQEYSYTLRATWERTGKEFRAERRVSFRGGQTVVIDLRPPSPLDEPRLTLQLADRLSLKRGDKRSFSLHVQRNNFKGPVVVQLGGLPPGVRIPEVTIPADKEDARGEATAGGVAEGTEQEVQVIAAAGQVKAEATLRIIIAHQPPLVEAYLKKGQFAEGEATLRERLKRSPRDDQARFGLGVLQFVRGVERLGQSLYKYGARSDNTDIPFLRLPVPTNPDPAPISYTTFRRILADFSGDLSAAEATLAGVTDDKVKLPLRLAAVHLDLDGDGKATDQFLDILRRIMRVQQLDFLETNPDFLVCFDRGDVAWLRAYCHLLMGMLDFYLAFDTEQLFDLSADQLFATPKNRSGGGGEEKQQKMREGTEVFRVKEPARLGRFRKHLLKVAELNRETWKYIRAETDDDHEWLPNSKQKGVLGLPVRDEMIDAWLAMVAELEALLEGKCVFPQAIGSAKNGKGLNLKTLFDDPPQKFVLTGFPGDLPDKYFSERREVDTTVLIRVFTLFQNTTAVAYAAWFN
jgi:uncharacterized protein (TIGR03000 family)